MIDLDPRVRAALFMVPLLIAAAFGWMVLRPMLFDTISPTATITAPPSIEGAAITTAGVLVVGRDVEPGDYQTFAPPGCAWAVLTSTEPDADADDVIAHGQDPGPVAVRVRPIDAALVTVGCGPWQKLP